MDSDSQSLERAVGFFCLIAFTLSTPVNADETATIGASGKRLPAVRTSPARKPFTLFPDVTKKRPDEVWISSTRSGGKGKGSELYPYDGHNATALDKLLPTIPASTTINFGGGDFYTTTTIHLKEGWVLRGQGSGLTRLHLSNGVIAARGSGAIIHEFEFEGFLNYTAVEDMTVDANRAGQIASANARVITDLVFTKGRPTATSISANFTSADLHKRIQSRADWFGGAATIYIGVVNSPTSIGFSSSSGSNVPLNASTNGTWLAQIDGDVADIGLVVIAAKSARISNVIGLGAYSNPGEGFPMRIYHDGSTANGDFAEISCCQNLDPFGYMTAFIIFDQNPSTSSAASGVTKSGSNSISVGSSFFNSTLINRTITGTNIPSTPVTRIIAFADPTHATISSKATANGSGITFVVPKGEIAGIIQGCNVETYSLYSFVNAYGGRQNKGCKILNNHAHGVRTGITMDTDDFANVEISGNSFITYPAADLTGGQAIAANGGGSYTNWRIHNNYLNSASTGGIPLMIGSAEMTGDIYDNTLVSNNSVYPAFSIGSNFTGSVHDNVVTESTASTFPNGARVSRNHKPDGKKLYETFVFASLPRSPQKGDEYNVTDSETATWGATATGGGSNRVRVRWNGSVWTIVGK